MGSATKGEVAFLIREVRRRGFLRSTTLSNHHHAKTVVTRRRNLPACVPREKCRTAYGSSWPPDENETGRNHRPQCSDNPGEQVADVPDQHEANRKDSQTEHDETAIFFMACMSSRNDCGTRVFEHSHEPVTVSIAFQPAKMLPPPSDLDLHKPVPISLRLMVQEQLRPIWQHNGRINFNSPLVFGKSLHFQMLCTDPERSELSP